MNMQSSGQCDDSGMKNVPSLSVFADEAGTHDDYPCYGIACLSIPNEQVDGFNAMFRKLKRSHGVVGELRWAKIGTSHGAINLALNLVSEILQKGLRFDAIIVYKGSYRNWRNEDRDTAFYKTYEMVLEHHVRQVEAQYSVFIDARPESYNKHHEALGIITNRMLRKIASTASIVQVTKSDSKKLPSLQTVDVLIGSITASHSVIVKPSLPVNHGKRLLIERFANMLGWDSLRYDTFPTSQFNIWHFPVQHRGLYSDKMRRKIHFKGNVRYVSPAELTQR